MTHGSKDCAPNDDQFAGKCFGWLLSPAQGNLDAASPFGGLASDDGFILPLVQRELLRGTRGAAAGTNRIGSQVTREPHADQRLQHAIDRVLVHIEAHGYIPHACAAAVFQIRENVGQHGVASWDLRPERAMAYHRPNSAPAIPTNQVLDASGVFES